MGEVGLAFFFIILLLWLGAAILQWDWYFIQSLNIHITGYPNLDWLLINIGIFGSIFALVVSLRKIPRDFLSGLDKVGTSLIWIIVVVMFIASAIGGLYVFGNWLLKR